MILNYKKELYNLILLFVFFNIIGMILPDIQSAMFIISIYVCILVVPCALHILLDDDHDIWDNGKKNR